jgi:hypothetical protein
MGNTTKTLGILIPTPLAGDYKGAGKKPRDSIDSLIQNMETQTKYFLPGDFHANHLVELEREKAQKMTAISGQKCLDQFKLLNPIGSSLKMLRDCLVLMGDWYSSKCALTWKIKATKYNRLLFQLVPKTLRIGEIESGLLPIPLATDYKRRSPNSKQQGLPEQIHAIGTQTGMKLQPNFVEWVMGYPKDWTELPDSKLLEMRLSRKLQKKSLKE